ncbi:MAG: hypothetical protein FWC41_06725, partial [Firmicutes bacterium]|nr:hypothetical protein [Bacillota bacterium]
MSYFVGRRNNKTYKQDGSEQYPFLIETAFDFVEFRNEIMNGNTFEGIHHKLVNDINLSGANFNILIENRRYYGTFDGNFKTIDNFTIISSLNADNFGLFTNMQGVCKNLRVTNGLINRTGLSAASTFATGFIGSSCSLGTIERCSIQGTIITPRG